MSSMLVHIVESEPNRGAPSGSLRGICGEKVEGLYVRNASNPGRSQKNLCPACLEASMTGFDAGDPSDSPEPPQ